MTDRIQPITMPKWGMTMTEGRIAEWLKAEGERIEKGEEFVEVETDKITNVVEADQTGTLRRIVVAAGDSAPCGTLIAVLAEPEVDDAELDTFLAGFAREAATGEAAASGLSASKVEAGGVTLGVVTARGPDGATPAVLLHGFGADAAAFMFNQEALAADRTIHAIELPSHGGSAVDPARATPDALLAPLGAALDQLAPEGVHLVGHSLGARLALRLAAERPDRVRSLALIAPAGFGEVNGEFVTKFVAADRRRPMKDALQMLVADKGAITSDMIERTLSYKRIDGVPDALQAVAEATLLSGAVREGAADDLAAVQAPVLVLWGAADEVLPPAAVPGHDVRTLPAVGHMPQMEAAGEVNAALAAHMAGAE